MRKIKILKRGILQCGLFGQLTTSCIMAGACFLHVLNRLMHKSFNVYRILFHLRLLRLPLLIFLPCNFVTTSRTIYKYSKQKQTQQVNDQNTTLCFRMPLVAKCLKKKRTRTFHLTVSITRYSKTFISHCNSYYSNFA